MMAEKKPSVVGKWRITHMEQWEQDFVDAEMPGFIRFALGGPCRQHAEALRTR